MSEPTVDNRSAGALLKAAREKQGLHIAALAAAIKVSQRKLEALEGDRLDELPDATFTRALAQTVCRTLKIDARPVLDLLPPAAAVVLDTTSGSLNAPFRERPGREEPGLSGVALRPLVLGAGLLMLAAAAVYLVPAGLFNRAPQTPPAVALPATQPAAAETPPPVLVQAPMVVAPAASEPAPAPSGAEPAMPAPVVAATSPPPAATTAVAAAAPAPAGLVQLKSREASWVEARDARGQVLLFRTVLPGESVGLDGTLPIRLTIGNAAATQLGFRGQPVDLVSRTRDNVARVELQ
jgi:cytoskeleton protein RodZ